MATLKDDGFELYVELFGDGKGGYLVREMRLIDTRFDYDYVRRNPLRQAFIDVHKPRPYYGYKMTSYDTDIRTFVILSVEIWHEYVIFRFNIQSGKEFVYLSLESPAIDVRGIIPHASDGD